MPAVSTETDAEVSISISRDPALVRTVRLVAAAVARRIDCDESLIEEIRLAVGEACAVMIGAEESRAASDGHVDVRISTDNGFAVTIGGRVESDDSGFGEIGLDPWALLRGLTESLDVDERDGRTTVRMAWPR